MRKSRCESVRCITYLALAVWIFELSGCSSILISPRPVAESFIEALTAGDSAALETLVKWDAVMISDFYVTEEYYKSQDPAKQGEAVQEYKKKFFSDNLPLARQGGYMIKRIAVTRGISDAGIQITFPANMSEDGKTSHKLDFTIRMKLFPAKKRWYIIEFGDLTRLQILGGNFNPGHFYFNEPVHP